MQTEIQKTEIDKNFNEYSHQGIYFFSQNAIKITIQARVSVYKGCYSWTFVPLGVYECLFCNNSKRYMIQNAFYIRVKNVFRSLTDSFRQM